MAVSGRGAAFVNCPRSLISTLHLAAGWWKVEGPGPGCRELVITINNRSADTLTPAHREADRGTEACTMENETRGIQTCFRREVK